MSIRIGRPLKSKGNHSRGLGRFLKICSTRPTNLLDVCPVCSVTLNPRSVGHGQNDHSHKFAAVFLLFSASLQPRTFGAFLRTTGDTRRGGPNSKSIWLTAASSLCYLLYSKLVFIFPCWYWISHFPGHGLQLNWCQLFEVSGNIRYVPDARNFA